MTISPDFVAAKRRKKTQAMNVFLCAFLSFLAANAFSGGPPSDDELIFNLQRYGNTPEKREAKARSREILVRRGPDALRLLMGRVHLENVMISVEAENMVRTMDTQKVAAVLAEFLGDEHPRTRKLAAYWLGFHDTPEYAARVYPLLEDDETAGAAIRTLGKWRDRDAIPKIVPFLSHEREVRRIAAVNALRDIGDASAIPELEPLLDDRYFTVRKAAERALAKLRESRP